MILAGLGFKVSAAPFHMWTPDVYQGAPTSVTAFMGAATKVAAMALMYRILVTAFPEQSEIWTIAVAVLAVASLAIGNLAAIAQSDVKRMLAYSSVSHAGFLLIAVAANSQNGATALLYYLVPYAAATRRRVRRRRRPRAGAAPPGHARLARGPRLGAAVPRRRDVGLRAQHGRVPADRRLPRQALRLLGDLRRRLVVARRDRRPRDRAVARVLPQHRAGALHAPGRRAARRRRRRRRLAASRLAARHRRRRGASSSRSARSSSCSRSSTSRATRPRRCRSSEGAPLPARWAP